MKLKILLLLLILSIPAVFAVDFDQDLSDEDK